MIAPSTRSRHHDDVSGAKKDRKWCVVPRGSSEKEDCGEAETGKRKVKNSGESHRKRRDEGERNERD